MSAFVFSRIFRAVSDLFSQREVIRVGGGTVWACLAAHTIWWGDTIGGRRTAWASLYFPGGGGGGDSMN